MTWHPMGAPSLVWRATPCGPCCRSAGLLLTQVVRIWQGWPRRLWHQSISCCAAHTLLSFAPLLVFRAEGKVHQLSLLHSTGGRAGRPGAAVSCVRSRGAAAAAGAAADAPRTAADGQRHVASRHGEAPCSAACPGVTGIPVDSVPCYTLCTGGRHGSHCWLP